MQAKSLDLIEGQQMVDDVLHVLENWGTSEKRVTYREACILIPVSMRAQTRDDAGQNLDEEGDLQGWDNDETPMYNCV